MNFLGDFLKKEHITMLVIYSAIVSYILVYIFSAFFGRTYFSLITKSNQLYLSSVLSTYFLARYYYFKKGGLSTLLWGYSFVALAIVSAIDLFLIINNLMLTADVFLIRTIFTTLIPMFQFMGTAYIFWERRIIYLWLPMLYGIAQYIVVCIVIFTEGLLQSIIIATWFYDVPLHFTIGFLLLEYGFYRQVKSVILLGLGSLLIGLFNFIWYFMTPYSIIYSVLNILILQTGLLFMAIGLILGRYEFRRRRFLQ